MAGMTWGGEAEGRLAPPAAAHLVAALCHHDPITGSHLQRLPVYTEILAQQLAAHPRHRLALQDLLEWLPLASTLHDVGKLRVPQRLLRKPGPLTTEEFALMKRHTTQGGRTLQELCWRDPQDPWLRLGCDIALHHHERWDGSGYPFGLHAQAIPLAARIVALADVYDALTSERPYKPAYDHALARKLILGQAGAHFDPDLVEAFMSCEAAFLQASRQAVREATPATPAPAP